jgi:uncharacterized membrane protein YdjX (TVP38/TMEM64 family)
MRSLRLSFDRIRPLLMRAVLLVALVVGLIALGRSDALHRELLDVLEAAKGVMAAHPVLGPLAFILLSALSALLAAVSSTVLIPAAIYAWGAPLTMLMLWVGWSLGGLLSYTIARTFGRRVLRWIVAEKTLARYQHLLDKRPRFLSVLLLQLSLPSEIPGHLLGLARYPLSRYLAALMLAELPYAVGAVLLGVGFVERDTATLVAVCLVGAVALLVLVRVIRARDA